MWLLPRPFLFFQQKPNLKIKKKSLSLRILIARLCGVNFAVGPVLLSFELNFVIVRASFVVFYGTQNGDMYFKSLLGKNRLLPNAASSASYMGPNIQCTVITP